MSGGRACTAPQGAAAQDTVRIGTRASRLALEQARIVAAAIRAHAPALQVQLVPMTTSGDALLDAPLDAVGGKGLFVAELDEALLSGRVDLVVHSAKDLPVRLAPGTALVAAGAREDPRDVLVLPAGRDGWDQSLPVGCSSARRRVQLARLAPGVQVRPVRGNVPTRLEKLDAGRYGALVLAAAGLARLGLQGRASRVFDVGEMCPAAGQGTLAVTARAGEELPCLAGFADADAMRCLLAERAFVAALGADCASPCAAYAQVAQGGALQLQGLYASADGAVQRRGQALLAAGHEQEQAATLARELAGA